MVAISNFALPIVAALCLLASEATADTHSTDVRATLAISIANSATLSAELRIERTHARDDALPVYIVMPFPGFIVDSRTGEHLVLHSRDAEGITVVNVLLPSQMDRELVVKGTIDVPFKREADLRNLYAITKGSFLYRTALGVDEQISVRLGDQPTHPAAQRLQSRYLVHVSEVLFEFPTGTKYVRDPALAMFEFATDDIAGDTYTVRPSNVGASCRAVVYRVGREDVASGLLLSLLLALISLAPVSIEMFSKEQTGLKVWAYGIELVVFAAISAYFLLWDRRYLEENLDKFVAPAVGAFVILIFFARALHTRIRARAPG